MTGVAGGEERVLLQVSPAPGESELRVVGAAAGWDSTVVVTHDGRVLTWGSNAFSQLGRPDEPREATRVGVVPLPDEVVQVASGLRHCAALTAGGQLWTWGSDSRGQLTGGACGGGRRAAPARTPLALPAEDERIVSVACRAYHTACASESGRVYVCGDNHGQTTRAPDDARESCCLLPVSAALFGGARVTRLRSGWSHLLAETDDGAVWSWGRADYGQLGRQTGEEAAALDCTPRRVPGVEAPVELACGSEHSLALQAAPCSPGAGTQSTACAATVWRRPTCCARRPSPPAASPSRQSRRSDGGQAVYQW